jgi:ribosomal protein S18 acetylase RimI-like enzyme
MYQWYILNQSGLSFVAIFDEEIVGFVVGSIGDESRRFRYTFWQIVWGFLRNPLLLMRSEMFASWKSHVQGLVSENRKPHRPGDGQAAVVKAALDSLGIAPDIRGKGIGKSLVGVFEQAARDKNASVLALGVESDNLIARRLYERCGWGLVLDDVKHNSANYVKELK